MNTAVTLENLKYCRVKKETDVKVLAIGEKLVVLHGIEKDKKG
jgi:hypothetical protein